MSGKRFLKKIGIAMMALAGAGAVLYGLWRGGAFLPGWIAWKDREISDRSGEYQITLERHAVRIGYGGEDIWSSPEGVKVQDVLSWDIDNDREDELVLLCWKIGRYGEHRPFWVERDEHRWSQHIFVYEYAEGEIRPKWMSSYLGTDVASICSNDREAPKSRLLLVDPEGSLSSWKWDSWGFAKEDTDVSFLVLGDNLIHEPIYRYGLQKDRGFDFLFENVREMISRSDVAVLNQETPLTDNPAMYGDYPRFGTPAEVGQAIVNAGFDLVTCATNHALDRGVEGVDFTKGFFESRGVECIGIQSMEETEYAPYEIIVRNGIRFALLNYTYGTNGAMLPRENPHMVHLLGDEEQVRDDIAEARGEADFILLFVHWGTEGAEEPDEFQREWARIFLESKVDVVVGTHPHALQPWEILTDGQGHEMLIYYSIGNFISAQSERTCVKGGMASFTVSLTSQGYRATEYDLQPLTITWQEDGKYSVDL